MDLAQIYVSPGFLGPCREVVGVVRGALAEPVPACNRGAGNEEASGGGVKSSGDGEGGGERAVRGEEREGGVKSSGKGGEAVSG